MQGALFELLFEVLELPRLNFVLALSGVEFGFGLGEVRNGNAAGFVEFTDRFGVFRKRFLGRLEEIIFEEKVTRGLGGHHLEPAVFEGDVVLLKFSFCVEAFVEEAAGALEFGFGLLKLPFLMD